MDEEKKGLTTVVIKTGAGLKYEIKEIHDAQEFNNMHAKNIKLTEKGYHKAKNKLALKCGALVVAVATVATLAITKLQQTSNDPSIDIEYSANNNPENLSPENSINNNIENVSPDDDINQDITIINPSKCDLSNFTIILRQATPNVEQLVSVAEAQLNALGVDNKVTNYNDNIVEEVKKLRSENSSRDIIVINVDGKENKGLVGNVIITDYDNDAAKSVDPLAIAIKNASDNVYDVSSIIRCGSKGVGETTETALVEKLHALGDEDVYCLTFAPFAGYMDTETNNMATAMVDGIVMWSALNSVNRYNNIIKRTEPGDTVKTLADTFGVPTDVIKSANNLDEDISGSGINPGEPVIVGNVPKVLSGNIPVENNAVTTDPNNRGEKIEYYEVQPGDTLSQIAVILGVEQDELNVPSGNPDLIFPGDKLVYPIETVPFLVSKIDSNTLGSKPR